MFLLVVGGEGKIGLCIEHGWDGWTRREFQVSFTVGWAGSLFKP